MLRILRHLFNHNCFRNSEVLTVGKAGGQMHVTIVCRKCHRSRIMTVNGYV